MPKIRLDNKWMDFLIDDCKNPEMNFTVSEGRDFFSKFTEPPLELIVMIGDKSQSVFFDHKVYDEHGNVTSIIYTNPFTNLEILYTVDT